MPHLICEYSAGLEKKADLNALGRALHAVLAQGDVFPLAGLRVRFHRCDMSFVGDPENENHFLAMLLRVGAGREEAVLKAEGDRLFAVAQDALSALIEQKHMMLSLDIAEAHAVLTWKANKVHARLKDQQGRTKEAARE